MDIMALVGPSGTGKSHRALVVAHEHNVDTIIDDGLLIKNSKIIAGRSAKSEASKIMAVRRAIFMEETHAKEVRDVIAQVAPDRILILGTSINMIEKIIKVLQLPKLSQVIMIQDIATPAEIEKAQESRLKDGKHVIPVPTIELKPHFSGYMIDPLEIFFKKSKSRRQKIGEKSIVRPIFSFYGKLLISDAAIATIVNYVTTTDPKIPRAHQINVKNSHDEGKGISIQLDITVKYGNPLWDIAYEAQRRIKEMVEHMTGLMVKEVNISVKRLSLD